MNTSIYSLKSFVLLALVATAFFLQVVLLLSALKTQEELRSMKEASQLVSTSRATTLATDIRFMTKLKSEDGRKEVQLLLEDLESVYFGEYFEKSVPE